MTTTATHVHTFGKTVHVDRCHFVMVVQRCKECGDVIETPSERNFVLNPMQVAFARDDCARCRELRVAVNIDVLSRAALTPAPEHL